METARKAIIVSSVAGQYIGCLVQDPAVLPILRLSAGCYRLLRAGYRERVGINAFADHPDLPKASVSFTFRLDQSILTHDAAHRKAVMRSWLEREFGVTDFEEKQMPSHRELCEYLGEPLWLQ